MRLTPIIQRLEPIGLRLIEGAVEFAGLNAPPSRLPAAYVVPQSEEAAANRLGTYAIDQRVTETIAVVLVLDAARRGGGGAVSEELEDWSDRIRDRLLGWQHPDAAIGFEYAGGQLLSADGTTLAWALRFKSVRHIRKVG
jgi:hypothetical protein